VYDYICMSERLNERLREIVGESGREDGITYEVPGLHLHEAVNGFGTD
jgi:hypothetical protein